MRFVKSSPWLLIFLGTFFWSLITVKSGVVYNYGAGFWGPHGHDGVWHLALSAGLARGSLLMPIFPPLDISNYHIGFDLILAGTRLLTGLSLPFLYFQVLPVLISVLLGLAVFLFTYLWRRSLSFSAWSLFFTYFAGSLGWVFTLATSGQFGGESLFWAQQAASTLVNPPYALSLVILFLALTTLTKRHYFISVLLLALLPQVKVYAGIIAFAGLFAAGLKDKWFWKVGLLSGIIALVLFFPLNQSSVSLVKFSPFWFLEHLMTPDKLNWPRFQSAISTYRSGLVLPKLIVAYLFLTLVFLVGNLGTRILAIFTFRRPQNQDWQELFLWFASLVGFIFPLLFLQTGTAWNTIQFFYYSQVFLGLLAALTLSKITHSPGFKSLLLSLLVILITIPTAISTLPHYLPSRPPAMISAYELAALNFLSAQAPGIVLTYPFDRDAAIAAEKYPPRPLYLYESTAYVSAYSNHPVYLEDEVNLNITNYPWQDRRTAVVAFFATPNRQFLETNNISYLYLLTTQKTDINPRALGLSEIFSNSQVQIFQVN